ncbi:MAG TPA: SDR family oxidoreductase, partial [Oligoflexia bacterium]|nr:SDR family oxidoreductase [Oligoflexia bacterium]
NFSAYTASKGGVWRLTETVAAELAPFGIFVNAIAPGNVNTKFLDDLLAAGPANVGKDLYERSIEQKSKGGNSPFKAADLSSYLISDASVGLYGKIISALWDDYRKFENLEAMSKSDIFTVKRIITSTGSTRWD